MNNKYISLTVIDSLDATVAEKILNEPYRILCKNFDTEQQEIKTLNTLNRLKPNFWKNRDSSWAYYILEEDFLKHSLNKTETNPDIVYSDRFKQYQALETSECIKYLSKGKEKLKLLDFSREKKNEEISEGIVEGSSETILLNKVIFDDLQKMSPEKAKEESKKVVEETSEIVHYASNLLQEFSGDLSIFSGLIEKSNGSTLKHMTRVFVTSLSYFQYYNYLLDNSGYVSKVRSHFNDQYRPKYEQLLPHLDSSEITLERVFKGGMRIIQEIEKNAVGVGFLLHDLGKQVDIEYFEGSEGYQRERIEAHAVNGFNEILKRTVYPPVVSAMAGFHHEYYGDKTGYGAFRDFINRKFPNKGHYDYCISYSLHEVYSGEAFSFFPAKILEIVDVYDALTDPGRKYRDPMKPLEAVKFIEDKFLKDKVKVDPILFDIFKLYLLEKEV